jgi:hypothetical protein
MFGANTCFAWKEHRTFVLALLVQVPEIAVSYTIHPWKDVTGTLGNKGAAAPLYHCITFEGLTGI